MESFHKSCVTNTVVCVEPWIKILQHRHVEEMSILTFDYIQNTLSFIEKKHNFFQTSVFFGQNPIENKKG